MSKEVDYYLLIPLYSNRRVRKKDGSEVKSGRQALQEPQALFRRVKNAEARAQNLQTMLEASQYSHQRSLQASQTEQRFLEGALLESQAEKRALEVRAFTDEQHITIAQQSIQEAEGRIRNLQQSLDEANARIEDLQQRVQDAERRTEEAERRTYEIRQVASEGEPSWVVRRGEINLTDVELGRGGWAVVRVAVFRGVHFAAKCLYSQIVSNYNRLLFVCEMNMAARVRHPNLLQFIRATLRGELIILTELMPTSVRGELESECTFSPNQINSISLDVARALNYLHLMQPTPIIHRDISSANVLLEPGPSNSWRAKVSDYGSVNLLQRLKTAAPGNPTYAAPEAENTARQSPKMDIFSFGVLLVEMCSARFPEVADREHMICSVQQPRMVALIRQCLAEDRNARPSANDIVTELSEPHS